MATIAIDYDDTFTSDPEGWTAVIELLRARGHSVVCITARFPQVPIGGFPGEVHYAAGEMKAQYAKRIGLPVDIWVDDTPGAITDEVIRPPQWHQRQDWLDQVWAHQRNEWGMDK